MDITALIGKTLSEVRIDRDEDEITFITTNGEKYKMFHYRDCCESVTIDDINGDVEDIIGSEILEAEERTNCEDMMGRRLDSFTWTFYTIATIKGYLDIKWLGESNGYYSESVDFKLLKED